jgi:hypothetical protein
MSWALGLRAAGCRVVWLEPCDPEASEEAAGALAAGLRARLEPYGLGDSIALGPRSGRVPEAVPAGCVPLEEAREADLFLNVSYDEHGALLPLFRRTAVVDFDPGLLQMWLDERVLQLPRYDTYFTTGETVGPPWQYAPECVALDRWPVVSAGEGAAFTTVSTWHSGWLFHDGESWCPNDKRDGFLPYLDLPRQTSQPLELALLLGDDEAEERADLEARGWRIIRADDVASTPGDYQRYVQASFGEFSCAKPSCIFLQNAWVSDRTLCYLASGKPAVVEHTGPSRILPDAEGLFRFRTPDEAVRHLEAAVSDYEHHARMARALVEEHFDAAKVVAGVLERAL